MGVYLITHRRRTLYVFFAFLCYFFDVALVFEDDFLYHQALHLAPKEAFIGHPIASIILGYGILQGYWLFICEYLSVTSKKMRYIPGLLFVISSAATLLTLQAGGLQTFLFYTNREVFLAWILLYIAWAYLQDPSSTTAVHLWRYRWFYISQWVFGIAIVVENVIFQLLLEPNLFLDGTLSFFPERSFAENATMVSAAILTMLKAHTGLSLRSEHIPDAHTQNTEHLLRDTILVFAPSNNLSKRETELLELVLKGLDNRQIASKLYLSISTVKVHVHNILKKTGTNNRQELASLFWSGA